MQRLLNPIRQSNTDSEHTTIACLQLQDIHDTQLCMRWSLGFKQKIRPQTLEQGSHINQINLKLTQMLVKGSLLCEHTQLLHICVQHHIHEKRVINI